MRKSTPSFPYILWMSIFIVVPILLVIFFAFSDQNGQFTIENISKVGEYMPVFSKSVFLGIVSTVICLIIGYPLAYLLTQVKVIHQKTLIVLIMLPMWMNFLLRTYAWLTLLENTGLINKVLTFFGLQPIQIINTPIAVVIGMVYNYLPFMILPLYSIMAKLDKSVIEAAQDLGANAFIVLTKVLIPLTKTGIYTGITMVFVPSISTFIISRLLGGGSNLLVGDLIEMQFLGNTYNPQLGCAIAIVLMLIILLCMSFMNQFEKEYDELGGVGI